MPSAGMGVDLFVPFTPFVPLTIDFGLGVPFGDGASCIGAGVDCASDVFSCDVFCLRLAGTSIIGAGDDAAEEESTFNLNLFSIDGGNVNTMTLVWFLMRPLVDGVDGIVPVCIVGKEVMLRNSDAMSRWRRS